MVLLKEKYTVKGSVVLAGATLLVTLSQSNMRSMVVTEAVTVTPSAMA